MSQTFLVTGATGHLGQRVLSHLLETQKISPARIVAATRKPEQLGAFAEKGVNVRTADFEDAASLAAAVSGVDRMLLISTDALDRPGRRLAQHKAAIEAAKQAGVKHVVYTSMPNPDDSLIPFAPDHLGTEKTLAASGLGYTILRNSWYMENLLASVPSVLAGGKWYTSAGNGRISHVAREDCARIAAAALTANSSGSAIYDVTGPEKHTFAEIGTIVSEAYGKPVDIVQVSDEQLGAGMRAGGVPDFLVPLFVSFAANTREGKMDVQSNAIEKLTGQKPQTLRDFFVKAARSS